MAKRVLTHTDSSTVFFHDEHDGKIAIESVADVGPVVERAKALHNEGYTRTQGGQRHVASIPIIVIDAWAKKQGLTYGEVMRDQALFDRFLKDPAHAYFIIDKASLR